MVACGCAAGDAAGLACAASTATWMASIISFVSLTGRMRIALGARDVGYWRLPSVSSAWPTLFCEVAALLDRNCIFRLSAVSLTMFEGWSPPEPMTSDSEVICEAWASSVWPQALDIASYQLLLSPVDAPGRTDAVPTLLRPTKLRTGLMLS